MNSRRQILRAHYAKLLRKTVAWAGLVALLGTTMVATPANALQLTSRKTTVSTSAGAATGVTYDTQFTFGTSGQTVGSIEVEICDSPLQAVSCVNSGNSSGANFNSTATGTVTVNSGTWGNAGTCALDNPNTSGNKARIDCTVGAITATPTVTVSLDAVVNPTAVNVQYYVKVNIYTAQDAGGTNTDFGGIALSTTQTLTVNANVQESLVFCVGATITSDCTTISGTSITLAPNPLTTAAVSYNVAKMAASTNALSGYVITYNATDMTAGGNTITKAADAGSTSTTGTEQFGFTLTNQTSGNLNGQGVAPSGGTGVTLNTNYDEQNSMIAYDITGPTTVAQASGPTAQTTFTMLYAANVAATTEPGAYAATQTYIATATF